MLLESTANDGELRAVLCDFGSALILPIDKSCPLAINTTPVYAPPEWFLFKQNGLINRAPDALKSMDIYAFGLLIHFALTGFKPWQGMDVSGIQKAVIAGTRPEWNGHKLDGRLKPLARLASECWTDSSRQRPSSRAVELRVSVLAKGAKKSAPKLKEGSAV